MTRVLHTGSSFGGEPGRECCCLTNEELPHNSRGQSLEAPKAAAPRFQLERHPWVGTRGWEGVEGKCWSLSRKVKDFARRIQRAIVASINLEFSLKYLLSSYAAISSNLQGNAEATSIAIPAGNTQSQVSHPGWISCHRPPTQFNGMHNLMIH